MSSNRDSAIARKLIVGYLTQTGFGQTLGSQQSLDPMSADILDSLVSLTGDYESRYRPQLTELANTWAIDSKNPRSSFNEVLDTIFADGCNWGRVVTIFIFVGMFLRKCRDQRAPIGPEEVTEWAADYLAEKIAPWIRDHGDWSGLVKFQEEGDAVAQMQHEGQMFGKLVAVAGAAGLVVLTLSTLLTKA